MPKILLIWKQADGWYFQLYRDAQPLHDYDTGERRCYANSAFESPQACAIYVWEYMRPVDADSFDEVCALPYAIVPASDWREADTLAAAAPSGTIADLVPAHLQLIHRQVSQ